MQRCFKGLILPCLCLVLFAGTAYAGAMPTPGLGVHISAVVTKNTCGAAADFINPFEFNAQTNELSTPDGPFHFLYLIACNYGYEGGIGGVEFGVSYPGAYDPSGLARPICVFQWTLCADLEFPSTGWPNSGGGNIITWSVANCGPESPPDEYLIFKTVGFFYLGAYGISEFGVTPRPVTGRFKLANCDGVETDYTNSWSTRGMAGFGFPTDWWWGCMSEPLPTKDTTWGQVKNLYR